MSENKKYWLGIISIVSGMFIPFLGVTIGVIGLLMKKHRNDLNYIGIAISMILWIMYYIQYL